MDATIEYMESHREKEERGIYGFRARCCLYFCVKYGLVLLSHQDKIQREINKASTQHLVVARSARYVRSVVRVRTYYLHWRTSRVYACTESKLLPTVRRRARRGSERWPCGRPGPVRWMSHSPCAYSIRENRTDSNTSSLENQQSKDQTI